MLGLSGLFFILIQCSHAHPDLSLFVDYFSLKEVHFVTLLTCSSIKLDVMRKFFDRHISIQAFQFDDDDESFSKDFQQRQGILLDLSCKKGFNLLQKADYTLFRSTNVWVILMTESVTLENLKIQATQPLPETFNVTEYLNIEPKSKKSIRRQRMDYLNLELNKELLGKYFNESMNHQRPSKSQVNAVLSLPSLIDSDVTLVVPNWEHRNLKYDLYEIYRVSLYTALNIIHIAKVDTKTGAFYDFIFESLKASTSSRRKDFNHAVLKVAASFNNYFDHFSRSEELTNKRVDIWAQMTFLVLLLIGESLNFHMLVKCFDDYGLSEENDAFSSLTDYIKNKKADLTATSLIFRSNKLEILDYIDSLFMLETGILLRQPTLSSVTNIFSLPFTFNVWILLITLLLTTGILISAQISLLRQYYFEVLATMDHGDIISFLSAVVTQQAYDLGITAISIRLSSVSLLFTNIFVFSSYSATIITLLQAPSDFIASLEGLLVSSLDLGIQDLHYQKKLIFEDTNEIVSEIIKNKINTKEESPFLNITEGIQRVRDGPFAFQVELPSGYRAISDTFNDREKCDITKLNFLATHFVGPVVPKKSPYRKILAQRLRWLREVGLINRIYNRWSFRKPKCKDSGGFTSVGIVDTMPLFFILIYGFLTSLLIFTCEYFYHNNRRKLKHYNDFQTATPLFEFTN